MSRNSTVSLLTTGLIKKSNGIVHPSCHAGPSCYKSDLSAGWAPRHEPASVIVAFSRMYAGMCLSGAASVTGFGTENHARQRLGSGQQDNGI